MKLRTSSSKEKSHQEPHVVTKVPSHYSTKKPSDSSMHSATERDWATPALTPAMKLTTKDQLVVSVLVEIVGCANLAARDLIKRDKIDPYVKVKVAKPKKGGPNNIHKTKPVCNRINPRFSRLSHSSFIIDGMSVEDLYECHGLLFKVKHNKQELGHLHLPPRQLLEATGEPMDFEWIHPLKLLPGIAGTVTLRCLPSQSSDIDYYKRKGLGLFVDYRAAPVQPHQSLKQGNSSDAQSAELDTDDSVDDGTPAGAERSQEGQYPSKKTKKDKSVWKVSLFGSSSKKKSMNRPVEEAEDTPTIVIAHSNDEEDTEQEAPTNESTCGDTGPSIPIGEVQVVRDASSGAEQLDSPHKTGDECLDVHTPKQKEGICSQQCCFVLCGW